METLTIGWKIFWCLFCLSYVAGFAIVKAIDKVIYDEGRDTKSWPHWATLLTLWAFSPVLVIKTAIWAVITWFKLSKKFSKVPHTK